RATASDSLSGTDVMAAMGMAQSQAGFGMAVFCGKHELSQNDKQKAINYLMQFAHKVSGKYRGVAKLEGNTYDALVVQCHKEESIADNILNAITR
ncbi:TPA: antitermination protein, partial [Escherichia coli]